MTSDSLPKQIVRKNLDVWLKNSRDKNSLLWFRSKFRDEFEANLPRVIRFLQKHKISDEDAYRITAIIGELGNNSFDHNLGRWPNGFIGNFIALRYNRKEKLLELAAIDFGVGFKESLKHNKPAPRSEEEAIKMGLKGVTGRVGEKRGNGLRTVVSWIKKYYRGEMRIQSNEGVIMIDTRKASDVDSQIITGTQIDVRLSL
jgi:anti-sigma regulatory factor (Ser/Thr protein kinase)